MVRFVLESSLPTKLVQNAAAFCRGGTKNVLVSNSPQFFPTAKKCATKKSVIVPGQHQRKTRATLSFQHRVKMHVIGKGICRCFTQVLKKVTWLIGIECKDSVTPDATKCIESLSRTPSVTSLLSCSQPLLALDAHVDRLNQNAL